MVEGVVNGVAEHLLHPLLDRIGDRGAEDDLEGARSGEGARGGDGNGRLVAWVRVETRRYSGSEQTSYRPSWALRQAERLAAEAGVAQGWLLGWSWRWNTK